jgi:hypothetical protein
MWMNLLRLGLLPTGLLVALPSVQALPMGSPGDTMVMVDLGADERELSANYAVSSRFAWGASFGRWEEMQPHGPHQQALVRDFTQLTLTHRVKRWNLSHAQANVWLVGQAGTVRGDGLKGSGRLGGLSLMADYETTRVYLGGGWRPMRGGSSLRHDSTWLRAGFSFYEVEYEQVQPWLIVETKQVRTRWGQETTLTPMLRFIHKRVFVEAGGNRKGGQLNFMLNL